LGLDPGSLITGYAVIDCAGPKSSYVASGSIRTSGEAFPERLKIIYAAVAKLAHEWQPQEVSIEKVFMHRNADSALKLGQARGAALCGSFAVAPIVFEYSARAVKQAVVGTGAAHKEQVQLMVKHLLKLQGEVAPDAADAIAIALCHAHTRHMQALLAHPARVGASQ
jgi:crossover junction endodeoxyribonuclease RuvC